MNDLDAAIGAVEMGAEVVRRQVGAVLERVDKGGGDFATSADLEAEAAMLEFLRRHRPNDRLVGEESGGSGTGDASRVWLIDPLCGTLNYAVGMRVVAVNAALSTPDGVVAAAVADAFAGDVFWADVDHACVRASGVDAPIVPSASSMLVDLNFDPPFPSAPAFRAVTLAANEEFCATFRPRVVSSSLALTWVASGQRAAYVTDGDARNSVHFSAGLAICKAAGCSISDLHGGTGDDGLIVAADEHTHATLVRLTQQRRR
jgi:myo-inositol-1(or 4)-monophosphatase